MTLLTLLRFLVGSRQAILIAADSRGALWLGLLFVLSAGLAREYDGVDLLAEPWHLVLPLAASHASGTALFLLVAMVGLLRGARGYAPGPAYACFLTLFWLTAPLAWVYAIPVERFLTPFGAEAANLTLLAVVALWRVLLIARVVSVLYHCRYIAALTVVLLFGSVVMQAAIWLMPTPVTDLMGGIRLSESEQLRLDVQTGMTCVNLAVIPVALIGTVCIAVYGYFGQPWRYDAGRYHASGVSPVLWTVAALAIVGWAAVLPFTQQEQRNRRMIEDLVSEGDVEAALRYMSQRRREDFPPHWDPPPRLSYGEHRPPLWKMLIAVEAVDAAPWVREIYREKLRRQGGSTYWYRAGEELDEMSDDELEAYLAALRNMEGGKEIAKGLSRTAANQLADADIDPDTERSERRRRLLREIIDLADAHEELENAVQFRREQAADETEPATAE